LSDALGFELPPMLGEPSQTTSPLPFDGGADEAAPPAESEAPEIKPEPEPETVH
jgi:hypothetical protein